MSSFRRLGDLIGSYDHFNRFGKGQRPGFRYVKFATFEKGAVTPYPTGMDAVLGAGAANITASAVAALRGNYGLRINIPNANSRYVRFVNNFSNEKYLYLTFLYNFNPLTMAVADQFVMLLVSSVPGPQPVQMRLWNAGGILSINTVVASDGGGTVQSGPMAIGKSGKIDAYIKLAAKAGDNDGYVKVFSNGNLLYQSLNRDNDTLLMTDFEIGCIAGLDAGTSGDIYLDDIGWSRDMR